MNPQRAQSKPAMRAGRARTSMRSQASRDMPRHAKTAAIPAQKKTGGERSDATFCVKQNLCVTLAPQPPAKTCENDAPSHASRTASERPTAAMTPCMTASRRSSCRPTNSRTPNKCSIHADSARNSRSLSSPPPPSYNGALGFDVLRLCDEEVLGAFRNALLSSE